MMAVIVLVVIYLMITHERELWRGPPRKQRHAHEKQLRAFKVMSIIVYVAAAFIMFTLVSVAFAQTTQQTYRDSMGRTTGRSSTDSHGNTTFYNERGQNQGRSSTSGNTTTFYDNMGRRSGTTQRSK